MTTKPSKNTEVKEDLVKPDVDPTKKTDAKPKFDPEELLTIFDEMIFSGEYVEEISLRSGKLKIKLRSRSAEDTMAISKDIDAKNFVLISTLSEYRALMNLAYSLVSYAGKDIGAMDIKDRVSYINKLPGVIVGLLSETLNKFDQKIDAACSEGEANF
jgi:hypothetical protein